MQQTLANILERVWKNPQPYEKMRDKTKIYAKPENCGSLVVKKCNKEIWQAHLTFRDRAKDLRFQKIQTAVLKGTIAITQVTSDLVKLKNNRKLTAKDIRKSIIPVIKTCTEAMTFLGHANQETDSIRRTNIAMSLPKDLYPLAKDVPVPSEWLFGDDIHARIHQKASKVDKTYFKPERTFDRQAYFPKQNSKNWERFPKIPGNQYKGYKDKRAKQTYKKARN